MLDRQAWISAGSAIVLLLVGVWLAGERPAPAPATAGQQESPDRFRVKIDGRWGYIDRSGSMAIEPSFQKAGEFSNGLAAARTDSLYGYIDPAGEWVIEPRFRDAKTFGDGLAPVLLPGGEEWGYVDRSGKLQISPRFPQAFSFSEGLAPVDTARRGSGTVFGYIDSSGDFVISPQYDGARHFSNGLAPVLTGGFLSGQWGYIDREGEMVIEPSYAEAVPFSEGLAAVQIEEDMDDYWTYIDREGKRAVEERFKTALSFSGGLAFVETTYPSTWKAIDQKGETAFELGEDVVFAEPFRGGLSRVVTDVSGGGRGHGGGPLVWETSDASWIYVDTKGEEVWAPPE